MNCPYCKAELREGVKFCTSCGHKLEAVSQCPKCGSVLKPGAKFCTKCGEKLHVEPQQEKEQVGVMKPVIAGMNIVKEIGRAHV